MGAQSVTGTGLGASNKLTTKEPSILANGPSILVAGTIDITELDSISSPPTTANPVVFNTPLPGSKDNYVVVVTGLNTGATYIGAMYDDEDGNFSEFVIFSEGEGTCMYLVTKVGTRPTV